MITRSALLALLLIVILPSRPVMAQCNTSNATSCQCPDGTSNCDLLPDITLSWYGILNYLNGPNEESGRIYLTGSTPNIGHGPLEIRGVDMNGYRRFTCGVDTFTVYDPGASQQFACPGGGMAKQLTTQRIFHKSGSTMTSTERLMPQGMTYHPTHGHTHFDQWGVYSLRVKEQGVSDPRQWPIVNEGYKLGFCLMDYNTCSDAAVVNHCKDDNTVYNAGANMTAANFPNYGLGGGNYGCGMVKQGISSGYTDIYSEYLDGMWIDIPSSTCNGEYWIIYEVDPLNVVVEENEDNNWTAVPITLTQQGSSAPPLARITSNEQAYRCPDQQQRLNASAGLSYLWSTGATSSSIMAGPGTYTVQVTTYCGVATSLPFTVTELNRPVAPYAAGGLVCEGASAELNTNAADPIWYDALGNIAATGAQFITPPLYTNTTYFLADRNTIEGTLVHGGKPNNSGGGGYHAGDQYLLFNANASFTLRSVQVYAGSAGMRTIELVDATGILRATRSVFVPAGASRVQLDMDILPGLNYRLMVAGNADLWRSNAAVSYPYQVGSVATITNSTSGTGFYYYFFDWEVEIGGGSCESERTPVLVEVEVCTGIAEAMPLRGIEVFPNPNSGRFTLSLHLVSDTRVQLTLYDALGKQVYTEEAFAPSGNWRHDLEVERLPKGLYTLNIDLAGRRFPRRVVVQ